jgi:death-on-curing protein
VRYLSATAVARINEIEVGPNLLVDSALLESAVARPRQSAGGEDAYPDIHSKAAALLESLALNHPFIDGNKRTAILATIWFYNLNGWWFTASQDELVDFVLEVVEGQCRGVERIAARLKEATIGLPVEDDGD